MYFAKTIRINGLAGHSAESAGRSPDDRYCHPDDYCCHRPDVRCYHGDHHHPGGPDYAAAVAAAARYDPAEAVWHPSGYRASTSRARYAHHNDGPDARATTAADASRNHPSSNRADPDPRGEALRQVR